MGKSCGEQKRSSCLYRHRSPHKMLYSLLLAIPTLFLLGLRHLLRMLTRYCTQDPILPLILPLDEVPIDEARETARREEEGRTEDAVVESNAAGETTLVDAGDPPEEPLVDIDGEEPARKVKVVDVDFEGDEDESIEGDWRRPRPKLDPLQEVMELLLKKLNSLSAPQPPLPLSTMHDPWGTDPIYVPPLPYVSGNGTGLTSTSSPSTSMSARELARVLSLCFQAFASRTVPASIPSASGTTAKDKEEGSVEEREKKVDSKDKEVISLLVEAYEGLLPLLPPSSLSGLHLPLHLSHGCSLSPPYSPTHPHSFRPGCQNPQTRPSSSSGTGSQPPIFRLPPELLLRIFLHLRASAESPPSPSSDAHWPYTPSRSLLQMDLHTLALVCRTWEPAARQAAYAVVSLRKKEQMDKLYSTIEQSSNDGDASEKGKGQGGRRIAAWIREIDVKVSTATRSMRRLRGGNAPISTTTGPFAWMHTGGGGHPFYSSSTVPLASSDTCGTSLGRLLSACPNVASVEVSISNGGSSYGYSIGAEFLEAGLLESLCTMRGLRSVTWRQSLDFGDLVEILREVKTIENLSLPAGVTNLSSPPPAPSVTAIPAPGVGIGAAVSSVPEEPEHQARLKSFQCSNWDFPSITPAQLCWILRPAVHTIKTLDLGSWSGNGAFGLNGAPQGGGRSPPWATAEVADLLVQMKAVERVALRDLHGLGVVRTHSYPSSLMLSMQS
ncbi:hypothetical protein BT69DRAFT_942659 [Atractiella rhizophila]|nr:hypothetical protein BT69DRAFT_942659 [Atractiella rhizophila]